MSFLTIDNKMSGNGPDLDPLSSLTGSKDINRLVRLVDNTKIPRNLNNIKAFIEEGKFGLTFGELDSLAKSNSTLKTSLIKIGFVSTKSSFSEKEYLDLGDKFTNRVLQLTAEGVNSRQALLIASKELGIGDFKSFKDLMKKMPKELDPHFVLTLSRLTKQGKLEEVYGLLVESGKVADRADAEKKFPQLFNDSTKQLMVAYRDSGRPDAKAKINELNQLAIDLDKMGIKGIDLKLITSLAKDSLVQIEKNDQARFAKENSYRSQVLGDANDLAAEDIKKSITNHISEYTKIGMRENQSAQIIRNLLNEVKQEMKEFLEAVKKSKEFSEDLKKMIEKKIETLDKEISQALNMKEIPQDKYQEIIGLISDLKDLPSIKNVINNRIKLSQTEKNSLLVTKFNNFEKIVIKMDDEIKKNVNQNSGAKAYSQGLNPTITSAAALSGLPKQEIEKISKDIKNISDELDKFIKKINKFLTENNLLKNATDDNGSIVSDLDKLGELIDNLKSSFTGNLSSKELSALLIKFNEAKGIEDKIEKMFRDDEGVLA